MLIWGENLNETIYLIVLVIFGIHFVYWNLYYDMKNVGEELADIVIRTADTASILNIDLEAEIIKKIEKNKSRGKLHGKKIVR